jgi:hypothetical protein
MTGMRPLVDGMVGKDGVDPQIMLLEPEEIFFRALQACGIRLLMGGGFLVLSWCRTLPR